MVSIWSIRWRQAAGATPDKRILNYCGGGIAATLVRPAIPVAAAALFLDQRCATDERFVTLWSLPEDPHAEARGLFEAHEVDGVLVRFPAARPILSR